MILKTVTAMNAVEYRATRISNHWRAARGAAEWVEILVAAAAKAREIQVFLSDARTRHGAKFRSYGGVTVTVSYGDSAGLHPVSETR